MAVTGVVVVAAVGAVAVGDGAVVMYERDLLPDYFLHCWGRREHRDTLEETEWVRSLGGSGWTV